MNKFVQWLNTHIWPWSKIERLRWEAATANSQLSAYVNRDVAHHQAWLATANQMWGKARFTEQEISLLDSMYYKGYGWRAALDYLAIAQRRESRQGVQYDRFEVN